MSRNGEERWGFTWRKILGEIRGWGVLARTKSITTLLIYLIGPESPYITLLINIVAFVPLFPSRKISDPLFFWPKHFIPLK